MDRDDARTYAGLLAASGVAVQKQIHLRNPPPVGLSSRLRPSGLEDVPRLLADDGETRSIERRLARVTSASLLYSTKKGDKAYPSRVLAEDEQAALETLWKQHDTAQKLRNDRSCPYCRLLIETFYGDLNEKPPVLVVNHSARVGTEFDPETNVSKAAINKFQLLLPRRFASELLEDSHPLNWHKAVPALFRASNALETRPDRSPGDPLTGDPDRIRVDWEHALGRYGFGYLYEDVTWPWNEDVSADVENIIRISGFESERSKDGSHKLVHRLKYDYSLERCIRSNFGVAWELSGLDIDDGGYEGYLKDYRDVVEADVTTLRRRDLVHLHALWDGSYEKALFAGWDSEPAPHLPDLRNAWKPKDAEHPEAVEASAGLEAIAKAGSWLERFWRESLKRRGMSADGDPICLLTVSASKRLHYTVPQNGPIELWSMLTWTAPALLLTFLNRAVCQSPHGKVREFFENHPHSRRRAETSRRVSAQPMGPPRTKLGAKAKR